ncbi:hypothetical protein SAMN04488490_0404 [Marinobacter sp. LV10R510-11A]|uniref:hypothetical protein n=1 Tax=Marinobacter sp. LV10R510-11A TaxID=1415568 RepID=UPI000BB8B9A7|nr:hypothetical protein [Marinobacter sp. LV10R510-11A]SOB74865.1 hypothetical protein SAMN04488490_0404 [Marinobacter sp. LV10R510-11A]
MAQNQNAAEALTGTAQGAVLRPGRAADPVPVPEEAAQDASQNSPSALALATQQEGHEESGPVPAESRQRKLRLMLRQCDRVLLMDFELMAMNDWPDNFTVAAARRSRDLWLFSALVAAIVFLSGLTGFVPAWIAGGGFGAFVIILLLGIPVVRGVYTSEPSYLDLLIKRQRMMRDARKHAEHLEGKEGLIWQCARMADFNPALKSARFSSLLRLSEQKALPRALSRREHIRLYLIYLLEAEKAYGQVQTAFFEGNQSAIDQGWQTVAAEPEHRT